MGWCEATQPKLKVMLLEVDKVDYFPYNCTFWSGFISLVLHNFASTVAYFFWL